MLGFPQEDADIFRRFIHHDPRGRRPVARGAHAELRPGEIDAYIDARIDEHRAEPRDDLTSFLLDAELDGEKLRPSTFAGR